MNGDICVVCGFVNGRVVECSFEECVINYINEDVGGPVFN